MKYKIGGYEPEELERRFNRIVFNANLRNQNDNHNEELARRDLEIFRKNYDNVADINIGRALGFASAVGYNLLVRELLNFTNSNRYINSTDYNNGRPLIWAIINGNVNAIPMLLEKGAQVDDEVIMTLNQSQADDVIKEEMINLITQAQHRGGGGTMQYNNKLYKIRIGSRGGKYIIVGKEKRKVYIK